MQQKEIFNSPAVQYNYYPNDEMLDLMNQKMI